MLGREMELLGDETDIVPLYYHIVDNFQIQFGREELCLVTGLRFGVKYWADYNNEDDPIPFMRRVFSSAKDGILQFVLLGLEDRRGVPNWILRDANVKRWPSLYATKPKKDVDHKTYSVFGFTWAFKGRLPIERLTPNEIEVGSDWWVSSRAYFDGRISEAERIPRHANNSFFEGAQATPSYGHNMAMPNWQTLMTSLPKKCGDKTKNKVKNANVSPLNLGNAFADDNVRGDDVMFFGERDTGNYVVYENVDPSKVMREDYIDYMEFLLNPYDVYLDCHMMGYLVPEYFWRQLVPHLCMAGSHSLERPNQEDNVLMVLEKRSKHYEVSKQIRLPLYPLDLLV
ncbi:hypothetical protein Tco_0289730 [Tanacetum coccineum]